MPHTEDPTPKGSLLEEVTPKAKNEEEEDFDDELEESHHFSSDSISDEDDGEEVKSVENSDR